jgi:hypothetical protein
MLSATEGPADTSKAPTHPEVAGKVGVVAAVAGGIGARTGSAVRR